VVGPRLVLLAAPIRRHNLDRRQVNVVRVPDGNAVLWPDRLERILVAEPRHARVDGRVDGDGAVVAPVARGLVDAAERRLRDNHLAEHVGRLLVAVRVLEHAADVVVDGHLVLREPGVGGRAVARHAVVEVH